MINRYITLRILFISLLTMLVSPLAQAFDTDHYPRASVLSQGRWIKVSVSREGLHGIDASTLRSWGFQNPERVRIYGRGGQRMNDALTPENYDGDLREIQSVVDNGVIVFYALGPGRWAESVNGRYHFETNVYETAGYYFLCESDSARRDIPLAENVPATSYTSSYMERLHHEVELSSPGEAGPSFVGEDFRYKQLQFFDFETSDIDDSQDNVWFETSFVSSIEGGSPELKFTVNGAAVPSLSTDKLPSKVLSKYTHGSETVTRHAAIKVDATNKIRIGISFTPGNTVNLANLNYLSLNYRRLLKFNTSGYVEFNLAFSGIEMAESNAHILDVSDPANVLRIEPTSENGKLRWGRNFGMMRRYAAWKTGASLPAPKYEGVVANQNLHGLENVNMVIVAPSQYTSQAQRLATMHSSSSDSLAVAIVTPEQIYNEFSSGCQDPAGLRNFFKMLYDRGIENGNPFRYALLVGRMSVDNRRLLSAFGQYPIIPGWAPWPVRASLSDNEGYFTDDFMAMLEDGSGAAMKRDKLSIAIGRMPMTSVEDFRSAVDKTIDYCYNSRRNLWRQRVMMLADDGDRNVHLQQSERFVAQITAENVQPFIPKKVYMGAFTLMGGTYPQARELMYQYLDEGVSWWTFIGHASTTGWTGEGQLSYTDLNRLYMRNVPFIYAATCDFLRLDGANISGAEILYKERYGGCIGVISAVRPVYIPDNGNLSAAIARSMATRDQNGRLLTPGEIYRHAKNDIRDENGRARDDDNRLRYVFVGDPALPLHIPSQLVRVDSINGIAADGSDEWPVMQALQRATVSGSVLNVDGSDNTSFNGVVLIDIYDAERSVTTNENNDGIMENFEDSGERIFCGSAVVANGKFTVKVAMPLEIKQNYRPATMALYAYSTDDDTDAASVFRNFYLYGVDEGAPEDTTPPVIEEMFLNHSDFASGATVNETPMLIARISDDIGINVSAAGIGHNMMAMLDGNRSFSDISQYFTPSSDGSPSGMINYPMSELDAGNHTLSLRIWDTSGNSTRREIEFFVQPGMAPTIYDVYSDANPASTVANFYLTHDQPDAMVNVAVTVYDLMGRMVWTGSASGRSDMLRSVPVTWDLTDMAGRRVQRGIYLYRASISAGTEQYQTASRRIAVTAR